MREIEAPTAEEIAYMRYHVARLKRRLRACKPLADALEEVRKALDGPPPTSEELAEARRQIVAQQARDEGKGGLF